MNLFTVNQVNQVYGLKTTSTFVKGNSSYTSTKGSGNVYGGVTPDGKSIYFKHAGPAGVTRSDLIDLDKIMYYKITRAEEMYGKLRKYTLTMPDSGWEALASGGTYMKAGYDFILRITLNNYIGISPEDSQYWKYGMVHTGPNMTPAEFWKEMAKSILRNMSRESVKFIDVYFVYDNNGSTAGGTTADTTALTLSNFDSAVYNIETTLNKDIIGIVIKEVEPDWVLGLKQQKVVGIEVTPIAFVADRAADDGTTVYWGYSNANNKQTYDHKLEAEEEATIINSKLAADYEYFFHGERGDQYRMVGWPDYIPTEYMVDPSNAIGYDFFQIHYSYIGSNESCQKSEKDITFLVPRTNATIGSQAHDYANDMKTFVDDALNALGADAANAAITAALGEDGAITEAIAGS